MKTVQGDFSDNEAAAKSRAELTRIGILPVHIRVWNIIPDSGTLNSMTGRGDPSAKGALLGGAIGGKAGFALGAIVGSALDDSNAPHLPMPSGVRVVVDANGEEERIQEVLRSLGATNVTVHK